MMFLKEKSDNSNLLTIDTLINHSHNVLLLEDVELINEYHRKIESSMIDLQYEIVNSNGIIVDSFGVGRKSVEWDVSIPISSLDGNTLISTKLFGDMTSNIENNSYIGKLRYSVKNSVIMSSLPIIIGFLIFCLFVLGFLFFKKKKYVSNLTERNQYIVGSDLFLKGVDSINDSCQNASDILKYSSNFNLLGNVERYALQRLFFYLSDIKKLCGIILSYDTCRSISASQETLKDVYIHGDLESYRSCEFILYFGGYIANKYNSKIKIPNDSVLVSFVDPITMGKKSIPKEISERPDIYKIGVLTKTLEVPNDEIEMDEYDWIITQPFNSTLILEAIRGRKSMKNVWEPKKEAHEI